MPSVAHDSTGQKSRRQAGFTLIELLVVLVILGLLATMVVQAFGGEDDKARLARLQSDIRNIDGAIERYRLDFNGRLPEDLSALIGQNDQQKQYLKTEEIPKDPWGNEYRLERDDKGRPLVVSNGPDESPDTDDDINTRNVASKKPEDLQKGK